MTRSVIFSDIHGNLRVLENILEHANIGPDDNVICAGDCVDRGPDSLEVLKRVLGLDCTVLLGNHEAAHLYGITQIRPYDSSLDPELAYVLAEGVLGGVFQMACAVDDILVSHAGLSMKLGRLGKSHNGNDDTFSSYENLTAEMAAYELNAILSDTVKVDGDDILLLAHPMVLDSSYPWWYRPFESYVDVGAREHCGFFDGFPQIVGHTYSGHFNSKQRKLIEEAGVTLIDPNAYTFSGEDGWYKYAEIIDGKVILQEGRLDA